MTKRTEPIEVQLEDGVDEGRRGFLKIFGATAVGAAVAGKGVAEAAKLLSEKAKEEAISPSLEENIDIETSDAWKSDPAFTTVEARPPAFGEEARGKVHPWNLVIEFRDWNEVDREYVIPFLGDNIDVEVSDDIKYISALYVIATDRTPKGIETPTITLRRDSYVPRMTANRTGIKRHWGGSISRNPKPRTLASKVAAEEDPDAKVKLPTLEDYEKHKGERLEGNLRKNVAGYMNPGTGVLADAKDYEGSPYFFPNLPVDPRKAERRRKAREERKRRERKG